MAIPGILVQKLKAPGLDWPDWPPPRGPSWALAEAAACTKAEAKSAGGILLPDSAKQEMNQARDSEHSVMDRLP